MKEQEILSSENEYRELDDYLSRHKVRQLFLVCGRSISAIPVGDYFARLEERTGIHIVRFSEFSPNPSYESVVKGTALFCSADFDMIAAVGGGSAMDVAKCIKLYAASRSDIPYIDQKPMPCKVPLLAVPTTAGTGSEATRFAVIYYMGEKQSISDESCIPDAVLFDASALETLPDYHRKAAMLDAFCHALESFWSVNSTDESRQYSRKALQLITANLDGYLRNEPDANRHMLCASNIAGKAINIAQTTAGHAMCYKLTSLYGIPHGYAAALCVSALWPYMLQHSGQTIDPRGAQHLTAMFDDIAAAMHCRDASSAAAFFGSMLHSLRLPKPQGIKMQDYEILKNSVNPIRMKNNPVALDEAAIDHLYHQILN